MNYIDFKKAITDSNSVVVDVRTPEEYEDGHIANAINIDYYNDSFTDEIKKLNKNKSYYIYCRSGSRSRNSLIIMHSLGLTNSFELDGGIMSWEGDLVQ